MGVASHHFCHILFVVSQSSAHIVGEEIIQESDSLSVCLPQVTIIEYSETSNTTA